MAERQKGAITAQMIGARLGTNPDIRMSYTMAHINAQGKKVNARLSAPFILNTRGKEDGTRYDIIVWGKLADILAKNWNEGKEMHFPALEHNKYLGIARSRVDRSVVYDKDGQALKVWRDSWILREFRWGAESQKTLAREIGVIDPATGQLIPGEGCSDGSGLRPLNWNISTHPDNAAWKAIMEIRSNTFFSPSHLQAGVFGFADIRMPLGGGQILFGAQYDQNPVAYQGVNPMAVDPNYETTIKRVRYIKSTVPAGGYGGGAPVVAAAPGAAMVAQPHVPLTHQVHTALMPVATNCVKCQAPLTPGLAFCGTCGTQVIAAAPPPTPGMPAGTAVYQAPPIPLQPLPVTTGAPFVG